MAAHFPSQGSPESHVCARSQDAIHPTQNLISSAPDSTSPPNTTANRRSRWLSDTSMLSGSWRDRASTTNNSRGHSTSFSSQKSFLSLIASRGRPSDVFDVETCAAYLPLALRTSVCESISHPIETSKYSARTIQAEDYQFAHKVSRPCKMNTPTSSSKQFLRIMYYNPYMYRNCSMECAGSHSYRKSSHAMNHESQLTSCTIRKTCNAREIYPTCKMM